MPIMLSETIHIANTSLAAIPGTGFKTATIPSAATPAPMLPTMFPILVIRWLSTIEHKSHAAPIAASAIALTSH